MRKHLTLPNLLRLIGTLQLLALWLWGLAAWTWGGWLWTLGTLLLSTLYIAVWLGLNDREAKP